MFQSIFMEQTLTAALLLSLAVYLFFVTALIAGVKHSRPHRTIWQPLVSIVVAARNEERALPVLLEAPSV